MVRRFFRHVFNLPFKFRKVFNLEVIKDLAARVSASEKTHLGELKIVIERALTIGEIISGKTARERALELFSLFQVWDTEENCGVLLYVLWADHQFEIVADRGISAKIPQEEWDLIAKNIQDSFRKNQFLEGMDYGFKELTRIMSVSFPPAGENENLIADNVIVLG